MLQDVCCLGSPMPRWGVLARALSKPLGAWKECARRAAGRLRWWLWENVAELRSHAGRHLAAVYRPTRLPAPHSYTRRATARIAPVSRVVVISACGVVLFVTECSTRP